MPLWVDADVDEVEVEVDVLAVDVLDETEVTGFRTR